MQIIILEKLKVQALNILTGVPVGTRELNCGFIRVILILE
jgi:hypothetical protein